MPTKIEKFTADPHLLTLTCYPPGSGPYERWEVTADATGEVVAKGDYPTDDEAIQRAQQTIREACRAYHVRTENEARRKESEQH